jgi:putative acetyltransferase
MIILIGGTGCAGKTLLANQLMRKTNIPYFPLDHLMMGIYRGMPNCGFTPMDGQFVLGEKLWPVIKGLIMTNIENDHKMILEGVQLLPHLLSDFPPDYLDKILPVFLFFSAQYIRDNLDTKIIKYRSAIESRSDISDMTNENLINVTLRLRESCINNGVDFFEIEDDYVAGVKAARDFILTRIKKAEAMDSLPSPKWFSC